MDDDSDDGNWKGESQFIRDENRIDDNYEDYDDENNYNYEYNENYNPNYNRKMDEGYEDKKNEDENGNQDYKSNNYDYYDDIDYNEDYDEDYYDYDENNNDEYNYKYNYNIGYYKNNNYRNGNHYNNNEYNRKYRNNNYRYRDRYRFLSRKGGANTSIKTKEFYLSTFRIKFKLWLMIVIKLLKKSEIKFIEDEKINEEIYESFINFYNYKKDKNENKNNLNFEIDNIEIKKIIKDIYNIEFNIIITEELKIYFTKKYINIKVKGEVSKSKYPMFSFQVNQYKLELNDESKDYDSKKKDSNIIIDIKGKEEESKFKIGMQPNYSIKNKNFRKYFEELQSNVTEQSNDLKEFNKDDDLENKKKGPQEEIIDIFFELNEILNKEKKTEK